jgi:hypothetical protein
MILNVRRKNHEKKAGISVEPEHIFPIIKKNGSYSEKEIFRGEISFRTRPTR